MKSEPAVIPLLGSCTRIDVFEPVPICCNVICGPALIKNACVPKVDGGEPKPLPASVTIELHVSPVSGVTPLRTGIGATVGVGVDGLPGVPVGWGVVVAVAVAPSGVYALKPEVIQGRRPSA